MGTLSQRHSPNRNQFSALAVTIEMDACNASHSLFTDSIHRIWNDLVILPQYAKGKFAWLMQAQDVLAHLWQQKKIMFYQLCIHLCYLILKHSVLIWCACMLQLSLSFEQACFYFLLSILCDLLMMVIPMVGKHGIAEAVFLFLFASVFQDTTLFSMMLLWRICTFYAPVFFYLCLVGILHVRIKQECSNHFAAFVKRKRK